MQRVIDLGRRRDYQRWPRASDRGRQT